MSDVKTAVIPFGQESSSSALFLIDLDEAMHLDSKGEVDSDFGPEDEVFFLVHHDLSLEIVAIRTSDNSDIQSLGEVVRESVVQLSFNHPAHKVELSHLPQYKPVAQKWYGRGANLHLDGRSLTADLAPCVGEISYWYKAVQFVNRPVAGLTVSTDQEWPTDVIVEYKEVS